MKTELENYFEFIDAYLDKSHKYIVEIKNVDFNKVGSNTSITFYKVMDFRDIGINGIEPYLHTHFSFIPKKLDDKAVKDIELGVANLREKGYNLAYINKTK